MESISWLLEFAYSHENTGTPYPFYLGVATFEKQFLTMPHIARINRYGVRTQYFLYF